MSFEDILVEAGGYGLYQKFLTFGCLAFSIVLISFTYWIQIFILIIPPHRCKLSPNDTQWIRLFNESSKQEADRCHLFDQNMTTCKQEILYDFSENFPTYASENNLVCGNAWKMYIVHTVYWIGAIFGTIIFGILNDKYGRKRTYQLAVSLTLTADVMTYFCRDYIAFLTARFFSSAGDVYIATIAYVLAIEHSIPSKRRLNIFVWSFTYAFASLFMVWIAYFVYNWEYVLMISWIPSAIAVVMSIFIPESPSWLLLKGREAEAVENIQRMARINGKNLSRDCIISHLRKSFVSKEGKEETIKAESQDEKTLYQTLCIVLNSPNLRKRILCLGFLWLAACACYNGHSLEFQNLPYSIYLTYSIGALIEMPGNLFVVLTLDRFGRRWVNATCFTAAGIMGIICANISNKSWIIVLVMIIRSCYASAFDITFSYSSELVPTLIRGRALSFIRTCGGIGNTLAPFVVSLAEKDALLPLMYFGSISVLAGIVMLTMPETAHQNLPQTIEEGEAFGKDQAFLSCPFSLNNFEDDIKENHPFRSTKTSDKTQVQCTGFKELKY